MAKYFLMDLKDIQPSQLYISSEKLDNVLRWFKPDDYDSYDGVPIKNLNGKIIYTDGHTRAFAAYLKGMKTIKVYWDEDELNWDAYQICVGWCCSEGIKSIVDLKDRVVSQADYEIFWINRCMKMHGQLGID